jgi:GNAT superfamily N-acetyltransferase
MPSQGQHRRDGHDFLFLDDDGRGRSCYKEIGAKTQKMAIREETRADAAAITEVTVAAFETMKISNHTEQFVIEALRAADALTRSLVAEVDGRVVGHIAFSPVAVSDGTRNWYGLGPVSVLPEYQRRGIGKALIGEGPARLRQLGAGRVTKRRPAWQAPLLLGLAALFALLWFTVWQPSIWLRLLLGVVLSALLTWVWRRVPRAAGATLPEQTRLQGPAVVH